MGTRWILPIVFFPLLITAEIFTVGFALLPQTSPLAFAAIYLLVPALSFLLALILSAANTHLLIKLLFPIVAFAAVPSGYVLLESQGNLAVDLNHLSADLGLALIVAFTPAALGTVVGLIVSAVGARRQRSLGASRSSSLAKATRTTAGTSARSGYGAGARRNTGGTYRSGGSRGLRESPPLRVVSAAKTRSGSSGATRKKKKQRGTAAYLSGNSRP
jgi:hypothetical protein